MGRILGIDHGDRRIGLALSDPTHLIASPLRTIPVRNEEAVMQIIEEIINTQEVELIVVGLPVGMQNQVTKRTELVQKFANKLSSCGKPVVLEDERLSTVAAIKALVTQKVKTGHNKGLVDQTAAAIILQQYLDRKQL